MACAVYSQLTLLYWRPRECVPLLPAAGVMLLVEWLRVPACVSVWMDCRQLQ